MEDLSSKVWQNSINSYGYRGGGTRSKIRSRVILKFKILGIFNNGIEKASCVVNSVLSRSFGMYPKIQGGGKVLNPWNTS